MSCICCGSPCYSQRREKARYGVVVSCAMITDSDGLKPAGRLLIFVNPVSGCSRSQEIFRRRLEPKLHEKGFCYEVVYTKRRGHAGFYIRSRNDLHLFTGIVICSGDGMIFEVVNGILERGDGFDILSTIPIGIVPSGSGNGLLASAFHSRNLSLKLPGFLDMALEIVADPTSLSLPVRLTHVQTPARHYASFHSLGWGLLSDIDIQSQKFRTMCVGKRFFWGALPRVINLKTSRGRLSFLPALRSHTLKTSPLPQTKANEATGVCDIPAERWQPYEEVQMPDVNGPVPHNWVSIDDEFVLVYVVSLSHIIRDGYYMPLAKLGERNPLFLTYILKRDLPTKVHLGKFLLSIKYGMHLDFPFCRTVPVAAVRLEAHPGVKNSCFAVDGEIVQTSRIQAAVTNFTMNVMCR